MFRCCNARQGLIFEANWSEIFFSMPEPVYPELVEGSRVEKNGLTKFAYELAKRNFYFEFFKRIINNTMEHSPASSFTREQKVGFIFMLIFAILTIGLGGLQLRNTIYGPFVIKATKNSLVGVSTNEETRLKNIDTDHDGLSDYDELNQYETSPYLPDTDSDEINDKMEIEKGTDPLCAEGDVCSLADAMPITPSSTIASPLINESLTPSNVLGITEKLSVQDTSQSKVELEELISNPAQLRTVLLSTGKIDAATLGKIDDVTLQKMAEKLFLNPGSVVSP